MTDHGHQNRWYPLAEKHDVYLHAKINFTLHFFLEIIHFKESCNPISQELFDLFFFRLFSGETNDEIFQKCKKTPFLTHHNFLLTGAF